MSMSLSDEKAGLEKNNTNLKTAQISYYSELVRHIFIFLVAIVCVNENSLTSQRAARRNYRNYHSFIIRTYITQIKHENKIQKGG